MLAVEMAVAAMGAGLSDTIGKEALVGLRPDTFMKIQNSLVAVDVCYSQSDVTP
jgi:hypothetical protein